MTTFAVMDENTVINIILADSKEDAETLSNKQCIEIVDTFVDIGYILHEERNVLIKPKPYASYILNDSNVWESPIPKPDDGIFDYSWNESEGIWEEFVAPDPKPNDGKKYHYANGSWNAVE
jgi:hypothetical protein